MKKFLRGASFFFAVLPALILLPAAGCRRASRPPAGVAATVKPSVPDQVIAQFTVDNYTKGEHTWNLESPKAFVFEPEKRVDLDNPHIRFFEKGKPGAKMDAGKGSYFTDTGNLRSWDGVVLVSSDGARVESPSMDYNASLDKVTSTAAVTVYRIDSVLRGVGWEAKPDLSHVVVHHQKVEYVMEDKFEKKEKSKK